MTPLDLRAKCRDYALARVEEQKKDFIRLGVLGNWEDPYLTLRKHVEVAQIGVFGEMAKKRLYLQRSEDRLLVPALRNGLGGS